MRHYHIHICVSKKEVDVIHKELQDYLDTIGGFTLIIKPDTGVESSPELDAAIKGMFLSLLTCASRGEFIEVN